MPVRVRVLSGVGLNSGRSRRSAGAAPPADQVGIERQALYGLSRPPAAPSPPALSPTNAERVASFLAKTPRRTTIEPALERPTPYRLVAGTLLPAVLLTGVNSDLPGDLQAQVLLNVFDSLEERHLLIPRGSRLLGRYDNVIAVGQNRLVIAWDRLVFPDGTILHFPGLPSTSPSGEAGLPGTVNNHLARVFGTATLLSLISAGAQLSQPQESATLGAAPSTRQVAAGALGQELSSVALEILRRQISVAPTIRLDQGTKFNVLLTSDLSLPGPYAG